MHRLLHLCLPVIQDMYNKQDMYTYMYLLNTIYGIIFLSVVNQNKNDIICTDLCLPVIQDSIADASIRVQVHAVPSAPALTQYYDTFYKDLEIL